LFLYDSIPSIIVRDDVLPEDYCQYVIDLAKDRGTAYQFINVHGEELADDRRTSSGIGVDVGEDDVIDEIFTEVSELVKLPLTRAEPMNIQRYLPGEKYEPHWDAMPSHEDAPESFKLKESGNRVATAIVYLNNTDAGTVFPELGLAIQGMQGRLLVFGNLDVDEEPHPLSLHMGTPPMEGEKWILTLWYREKDFMHTKEQLKKSKASKQKAKQREFNSSIHHEKHQEKVLSDAKKLMSDRGSMPI